MIFFFFNLDAQMDMIQLKQFIKNSLKWEGNRKFIRIYI